MRKETNMDNFEEEFEKMVQKADEEKELKKLNRAKKIIMFIELSTQLIGFLIVYFKLGGLVAFAIFLLLLGNNLQIIRNVKKN